MRATTAWTQGHKKKYGVVFKTYPMPSELTNKFKDMVNTQSKKVASSVARVPPPKVPTLSTGKEEKKEGEDAPQAAEPTNDKRPKVWHPQQEKLLKQWAEISTSFRWMHHQAHLRFASMHFWFTLPVIVMSSITGTMNFAQGTFPPEYETYVPLLIGSVNLIAGIITTIASYLRVSELSEGNRVASMMFGKLSRNIRVELLLPTSERTMDGCDFIAMCRSELDRLTEQTPDIPKIIENKFLRKFHNLLENTDFYPPEIADLHPVQIYHDVEELKNKRVGSVLADAALAFKIAGERRLSRTSSPVPSPPLNPVPAPVVPLVEKMDLSESRDTLNKELSQLSTLQPVSARLSSLMINRGAKAREQVSKQANQGIASVLGATQVATMANEIALTNALFEEGTKSIELTAVTPAAATADKSNEKSTHETSDNTATDKPPDA